MRILKIQRQSLRLQLVLNLKGLVCNQEYTLDPTSPITFPVQSFPAATPLPTKPFPPIDHLPFEIQESLEGNPLTSPTPEKRIADARKFKDTLDAIVVGKILQNLQHNCGLTREQANLIIEFVPEADYENNHEDLDDTDTEGEDLDDTDTEDEDLDVLILMMNGLMMKI